MAPEPVAYLEINTTGSHDDSAPSRDGEACPILTDMEADHPYDESSTCDQIFVLRCWRESPTVGAIEPDWRVRLSRVNTRDEFHVFGIESAFELIRQFLAEAAGTTGDAAP
ncbi:MAG: hypothetical protein V3U23_02700 [Kiloniellales bacterium]|jgi:hypothetical protein